VRRAGALGGAGLLVVVASAAGLGAADVLGPSECIRCHSHGVQARAWQERDVERSGDKAHVKSLDRLRSRESATLARAAGVSSPRDALCTKCHATVVRGRPRAGVSCESCHGAGKDYLEVHQKKDQYAPSVAAGMRDLRVKVPAIVELCVSCHVTTDPTLVAAGHPVGETFDVAKSLALIEHWSWEVRQTRIDMDEVGRLGRLAVADAAAAVSPEAVAAAKARMRPSAGASPAEGAPVSLDPSQAVPLPDDYREEPSAPPAENAWEDRTDEEPASAESAGGATRPSGVGDTWLLARGRAVRLLVELLRAGRLDPDLVPPPAEYSAPDGGLARLQDEALALAAEAARARQGEQP
jgi:hypothetical protein